MAVLAFDIAAFRAQFPGQFPDPPNTDALVEIYWNTAICYVSPEEVVGFLPGDCRRQAINLMVAHLISLRDSAVLKQQSGYIASGSIDKISVSFVPFPAQNQYQAFLNQTTYGIQLYAMLYTQGSGGFYFGGLGELAAFRRVGGVFTPPTITPRTVAPAASCPLLSRPPNAPFLFNMGAISGGSASIVLSVLAGCEQVTASFTSVDPISAVTIEMWSGFAVDSLNRFDIFYFDSTAREEDSPPTASFAGVDATGVTNLDGFSNSSLFAGPAIDNPNLIVITGARNADEQQLHLRVSVT